MLRNSDAKSSLSCPLYYAGTNHGHINSAKTRGCSSSYLQSWDLLMVMSSRTVLVAATRIVLTGICFRRHDTVLEFHDEENARIHRHSKSKNPRSSETIRKVTLNVSLVRSDPLYKNNMNGNTYAGSRTNSIATKLTVKQMD